MTLLKAEYYKTGPLTEAHLPQSRARQLDAEISVYLRIRARFEAKNCSISEPIIPIDLAASKLVVS